MKKYSVAFVFVVVVGQFAHATNQQEAKQVPTESLSPALWPGGNFSIESDAAAARVRC
jgi:hypothetical protein